MSSLSEKTDAELDEMLATTRAEAEGAIEGEGKSGVRDALNFSAKLNAYQRVMAEITNRAIRNGHARIATLVARQAWRDHTEA